MYLFESMLNEDIFNQILTKGIFDKALNNMVFAQENESKTIYTVRILMPGYQKDRISASVQNGVFEVKATLLPFDPNGDIVEPEFNTTFNIPQKYIGAKYSVTYKDGILEIKAFARVRPEDRKINLAIN